MTHGRTLPQWWRRGIIWKNASTQSPQNGAKDATFARVVQVQQDLGVDGRDDAADR